MWVGGWNNTSTSSEGGGKEALEAIIGGAECFNPGLGKLAGGPDGLNARFIELENLGELFKNGGGPGGAGGWWGGGGGSKNPGMGISAGLDNPGSGISPGRGISILSETVLTHCNKEYTRIQGYKRIKEYKDTWIQGYNKGRLFCKYDQGPFLEETKCLILYLYNIY